MKLKLASIDFEFTDVAEKKLRLVCCSILTKDYGLEEFWLLNESKSKLISRIDKLHNEGYTFIAHGVSAEASSFISMNLKAQEYRWICTFAEFRCISNHNHDMQYGNHLVDGKVKFLYPPKNKWEMTEEDKKNKSGKITHSLSQLVYKTLGVIIDTDHKTKMRDIIISGDEELILKNKKDIQDYCSSDVKYLVPALKVIVSKYKGLLTPEDSKKLRSDMLLRGDTMVHTAIMERNGYPIAFNNLRNFTLQIQDILNTCAEDINRQFPDMGLFVWNKKERRYARKEAPIKEWVANSKYAKDWLLTDTKQYSLGIDAFSDKFHFRHSYPEGDFGAQQLRYLKLKQSLNGFTPSKKGKKTFWDSVGSDRRVRAYLNPYGSLSGRYQPPSTSFLFLKPAWMRSLCVPPKGRMIVGIDIKSEEFLISGLWGKDLVMIRAYESGDVYLAYAKDSGMVPIDATKATHPIERQSAKSAVLGISYLMTKFGLAIKMSQDLGREVSEDEAQEYITLFDETYEDHSEAVQDFLQDFAERGYERLRDGWTLFADNENFRSIANFPKQGGGGCILRRAVKLSHDKNLMVIAPLHDALYYEVDLNDWDAVSKCIDSIRQAFIDHYKGTDMEEFAKSVMVDVEVWSPELEKGSIALDGQKISIESIHKDERAGAEYDTFKKYFRAPGWSLL